MPEPLPPCSHGVPGHYGCVQCMHPSDEVREMVSSAIAAGILYIPPTIPDSPVLKVGDPKNLTDFEHALLLAMTRPLTAEEVEASTRYTCGFRGPSPTLVVVDEAAEFPPSDMDGNDLPCDRCSSTDDVRMLTSCRDCGPVPLCDRCRDAHAEEMCEDAEYDGTLQRGLN